MHIIFTDEEKEYLEIDNFKASIKNGCPKEVEETLRRKLKLLDRDSGKSEKKN